MVRPLRSLGMAGGHERLLQQLLKVRLSDINDVVRVGSAAGRWMVVFAVSGAGGPERTVRPVCKYAVVKVAAEQAEFPELIGDVFADIRHDAIGSHDDFFTFRRVIFVFETGRGVARGFWLWALGLGLWGLILSPGP